MHPLKSTHAASIIALPIICNNNRELLTKKLHELLERNMLETTPLDFFTYKTSDLMQERPGSASSHNAADPADGSRPSFIEPSGPLFTEKVIEVQNQDLLQKIINALEFNPEQHGLTKYSVAALAFNEAIGRQVNIQL